MKILAIDTSCDETSVAVTEGAKVLSNIVWSQVTQHAKFGGVMPSLAQRLHEERIDWTVERALRKAGCKKTEIGAVAVTAGPGLAIALGVGIKKAKELAGELKVPIIGVNHIEGHLLSPLAETKNGRVKELKSVSWPALGLVVSGGHTELILIKEIGNYEILARTLDDALGEALDKAARMLGLGYPGGAILEKMAKNGNLKAYPLPLPMAQSEIKNSFSYSGLKTAMYRLINAQDAVLGAQEIKDLAASFQARAFQHLERVINNTLSSPPLNLRGGRQGGDISDLLVGGGVAANMILRKRLRKMGRELGLTIRFPYSVKLCGDNAAMIGVAAGFKVWRIRQDSMFNVQDTENIDRKPRWRVDEV